MEDTCVYPVLVEFEEHGIPRLKAKLTKYFQSKKSNGGECEVEHESGSQTATVRFHNQQAQKNVLSKETHEIIFEGVRLKMTVRLPIQDPAPTDSSNKKPADVAIGNKEPGDDGGQGSEDTGGDTPEEELGSTVALIENIPDDLSQEFLAMLVECISKDSPDSPSDSSKFTLEIFPDLSSAAVSFQNAKDCADFVTGCPENRRFRGKQLTVRTLEVTKQVAVEVLPNMTEDHLCLYFENEGVNVEKVKINEGELPAVITLEDHRAAQKILKKKHHIGEKEVNVFPFYESLGQALYGKDKLRLPASVSEPIDSAVWRYLTDNPSAAHSIHSTLAKSFCSVNLDESTACLSPMSSILQQNEAKSIIKEWRSTVKAAFVQAVSKFKSIRLQPELEVWEESEEKVRQIIKDEDVALISDKASGVLLVAGPESDVNRLENSLGEGIDKIAKRAQRQKFSRSQKVKMSPSLFHLLCHDGLRDKIQSVYPELEMSYQRERSELRLTGYSDEISQAQNVICESILCQKRLKLDLDPHVLSLLQVENQEELTDTLLTSHGINAAFDISAQTVQLLAFSDRSLEEAEEHVHALVMSRYIPVKDSDIMRKPEWNQLLSQINTNSKSYPRLQVHTTGQQVVVSGLRESVVKVCSELEDFIKQNSNVEETIVVKPNILVEFVKKMKSSRLEEVKDTVLVSYREEAICLSGSSARVTHCKTLVEDLVSSLCFETVIVSKPGMKKFFKDKESMYTSTLMTDTGCLVRLVDVRRTGQDSAAKYHKPKPAYVIQTSDGVEIAVCNADMCSYPVDAVVSSSGKDLKLVNGLAAALLKTAGPELQVQCDKIISSRGQLKPGDCVITDAMGGLCCSKVIHAVGPKFDPAAPQKPVAQLKKAVKSSLELAESHSCSSVALPVISQSLDFPLDLCVKTIMKAVKEYCEERYDDSLKKIHLVNNDDTIVKALVTALKHEFKKAAVARIPQLPATPAKVPRVKHVGSAPSDPNVLGQVKTNEGLDIILVKGNIEKAKTDVIVNSVSADLMLNNGAISQAIQLAAGPQLQQLVTANNSQASFGDIIETEGCQLQCKQVFHAVAVGQGINEQIITGIFKDCLDKAEDNGMTSISFPAIGTGNMGFSKNNIASSLLKEISAFSSRRQPKHLKKVVVLLYPKDSNTIQAFTDEFQNMFPSGAVAASSPQCQGVFSKVVSSPGMYETKVGSVAIEVVSGDITKETSDVIVNSSNENFSLKSGVSKAVLEAAGPTVEAECLSLGAQVNTGLIMTQPGNLKCQKILHVVGQRDPVKVNKIVDDALQMCLKDSYRSVSFPAIGTGQGNVQAKLVADAMFDAVSNVLSQNPAGSLNKIRFVIFQQPMLKDFHNSMVEREQKQATKPKDTAEKEKETYSIWERFISFFGGGSSTKQTTREALVTVEAEPTHFHICGDSQAKVDLAKTWINDLINKEQHSNTISDLAIADFSNADQRILVDLQIKLGVRIILDNTTQPTLKIEGFSKDVLEVTATIYQMLKKVKEEEELKRDEEMAQTVAEWQYQQLQLQFQSFDSHNNFLLERAFQRRLPNVDITVQQCTYTVTMPGGPATDSQGNVLQIKRIDKLKGEEVPDHWAPMPATSSCHSVTIEAGSKEYTDVLTLFQASCKRNIIKIERIQNPVLWKSLLLKKRDMEQRNGHQNNERQLFHGTTHDIIKTVNEHGFNRSYAGKNAACYGNGTYFAVNASYSANDTYSKPNQNGEKCMYLCRVLTGDFTVGKANMITPPAKSSSSVQMYDSVVDNVATPSMFVIFHDTQACPEYLITFK